MFITLLQMVSQDRHVTDGKLHRQFVKLYAQDKPVAIKKLPFINLKWGFRIQK